MQLIYKSRGVTKGLCLLLIICYISLSLSGCIGVSEYVISGQVSTSTEGQGVPGVTIELSGDTSGFVITDENGHWKANVSGTVTVAPSQDSLAVEPAKYTVSSATTGLDFVIEIMQHSHGISNTSGEVELSIGEDDVIVVRIVDDEEGTPVDGMPIDSVVIGDQVAIVAIDPSGEYLPSIQVYKRSELVPLSEVGAQAVFFLAVIPAIKVAAAVTTTVIALTKTATIVATTALIVVGAYYTYRYLHIHGYGLLIERIISLNIEKDIVLYLPGQGNTHQVLFPSGSSKAVIEETLSAHIGKEQLINLHSYEYAHTYVEFFNYEPEEYDISGLTLDENYEPIADAKISFYIGNFKIMKDEITDKDGRWDKGGLIGLVEVRPEKSGILEWVPPAYLATMNTSNIVFIGNREDSNGTTPGDPGDQISHNVNGVEFNMRLAPASTFPTGIDDDGEATVEHDFWVAETQVTYELWYEVRMWALDNGYTFANAGREGSEGSFGGTPSGRKNEPVTTVNWYDSIVWCNALSEYLGFDAVYTRNGVVIKSTSGIDHLDIVAEDRDGFRLPTSMEWELAARYMGSDSSHGAIEYPVGSGSYWTPGNYASGATDSIINSAATKAAAWYEANSNVGASWLKSQNVGQKPALGNSLGVFDMSGNVREWCFTRSSLINVHRVIYGGSWLDTASFLRVGFVFSNAPGLSDGRDGFRFVRTNF